MPQRLGRSFVADLLGTAEAVPFPDLSDFTASMEARASSPMHSHHDRYFFIATATPSRIGKIVVNSSGEPYNRRLNS